MFAPSNLSAASLGKHKASNKDGYLEIEMSNSYGDLESTWDVVMAWMQLQAIWQKLFPDWPAAVIGLRIIFTMKLFMHCGKEDKKLMVEFSNKFLKANALRAANKEPPMDFSRGLNLAGNVCHQHGYEREPPATKSVTFNQQAVSQTNSKGTNNMKGRGGKTFNIKKQTSDTSVPLHNGQKVCHYWQTGACREQGQAACTRNNSKYVHVCAFLKAGGQLCGRKDHQKSQHDPSKH